MAEYIGKVGVGSYFDGETPPVSLDSTGAVRTAGNTSATFVPPSLRAAWGNGINSTGLSMDIEAGLLCGWYLSNSDSVTINVRIYNSNGVNPAVDVPFLSLPVPAGGAANVLAAAGFVYDVGLFVRACVGLALDDTISPAGNVTVNVFFLA